jgi:hypothetical protein
MNHQSCLSVPIFATNLSLGKKWFTDMNQELAIADDIALQISV